MGELADRRSETEARIYRLRERLEDARALAEGKACVYATALLEDAKQVVTAIWTFSSQEETMEGLDLTVRREAS